MRIDWLTITVPPGTIPGDFESGVKARVLMNWSGLDIGEVTRGIGRPRNYTHGLHSAACSVSWHPAHPDMFLCLNCTGEQALAPDIAADLIARVWREKEGRVTRIDIAWDTSDPAASPAAVLEYHRQHPNWTTARQVRPMMTFVQGEELTTGIYVGGRTSDRYLVIYDKAFQNAGSDINRYRNMTPHTRIELRLRGEYAARLAETVGMADNPRAALIGAAQWHIQTGYPLPLDWYHAVIRSEINPINQQHHPRNRKTDEWLLHIVMPTLTRRLFAPDADGRLRYQIERLYRMLNTPPTEYLDEIPF